MSTIGTATAGMTASLRRVEAVAERVAAAGLDETRTDEARAARRADREAGDRVDLSREAANLVAEKATFAANVAVARTGSRMTGRLLDLVV